MVVAAPMEMPCTTIFVPVSYTHLFGHSGIEAVAAQVVQAVHIQLPAYQLVQEALGVFILSLIHISGGHDEVQG